MSPEIMRKQCLDMIERIFDSGKDMYYPVAEGTRNILLCGSAEDYVMSTDFGPKTFDDASDVLDALLDVERLQGETDALSAVNESLRFLV